ncbi:LytTR family DNA-binding domain-containing protein [Maricaulis maris]|uniref:LytTR family DNA-binding domain-containing protein n=1 Tax=Maricaulis maris TaxID=74318 RepID=UPI001475ECF4|nr:LytTR family DNA-binding domain-containing protein [Maricaulis maris]
MRILFATTAAWIGLLVVFTLAQSLDMSRLGIAHTIVEIVQGQSVIMIPWLGIFPAVAITRARQALLATPTLIALSELVMLGVAAIFLVYLHIVFVYAPFLDAPPAQILDQIPLINWVWDPVMIALTALLGDVYAGSVRRQASQTEPAADHIILRSGSQEDILDMADIIAVSAQGNYVALISHDREWLHRATLAELVVQLTRLGFIHIHRSHLVRSSEIASCARERGRVVRLTLRSGQGFPVSARGAELLQAHLANTASSRLALPSQG